MHASICIDNLGLIAEISYLIGNPCIYMSLPVVIRLSIFIY